MKHYSVMLNEAVDALNLKEDSVIVDATMGYAGHSSKILENIPKGHLYGIDQDNEAIDYATKRLSEIANNFTIIHSNFVNVKEELDKLNVDKVDGILFDLGVSSPQIDDAKRGFSFMKDAKLDMRMNQDSKKSAYDVVNNYSEEELVKIFYEYGEEVKSKVIAKNIVTSRPINTTMELCKVIEKSVGAKYYNLQHPERKIFQAIRIEVNNELNVLNEVLPQAIDLLKVGGRIAVITFHSKEDRIVKQIFKKESSVSEVFNGLPNIPDEYLPKIRLVNKKPLLPSDEEIEENSRSKSAKLRVIERVK